VLGPASAIINEGRLCVDAPAHLPGDIVSGYVRPKHVRVLEALVTGDRDPACHWSEGKLRAAVKQLGISHVALALIASVGACSDSRRADDSGSPAQDASQSGDGGSSQGHGRSDSGADAATAGDASHHGSDASAAHADGGGTPPDDGAMADAGSWMPPFSLGNAMWQQSSAPLCPSIKGYSSSSGIWSDQRGVFVLASVKPDPFVSGGTLTVQFNDGSGWTALSDVASAVSRGPRGLPNGPLVFSGADCGIQFYEPGGNLGCSSAIDTQAVFGVNAELAYAISGDRLLEYRGNSWTDVAGPLEPGGKAVAGALWANDKFAIVTASADESSPIDRVYSRADGEDQFHRFDGLPSGWYTAVWAFAQDDIWLGDFDSGNLVHFDGSQWASIPASSLQGCRSWFRFWGQDGTLYFVTNQEFGRVRDSSVEILQGWSCDTVPPTSFVDLWGNTPNEVFIAVEDQTQRQGACGPSFAVWWNGTQLNRL
jgi:hypothetical protein